MYGFKYFRREASDEVTVFFDIYGPSWLLRSPEKLQSQKRFLVEVPTKFCTLIFGFFK